MKMEEINEKGIDIGSCQLQTCCIGQGKPTIIIEAGLGDGMSSWRNIQMNLSPLTCVFAYDRAGVGKSTQGPKPRTSQQMVTELHTLLDKAKIEGPYVLVGHSLGGLNAILFAANYPVEMAGIVLVDPSFPGMFSQLESTLGKFWMLLWNSQFTSAAEGMTKQDFETSCKQVADVRLPDIPLVVISAGQPVALPPVINSLFPGAKMVRVLQEGHAALAKQSSHGTHLIAENSTHITIAQDALIDESIRKVVALAKVDNELSK